MSSNSYWGFFSHTTDHQKLAKILKKQYQIHFTGDIPDTIEEIYQHTLTLCGSLGGAYLKS